MLRFAQSQGCLEEEDCGSGLEREVPGLTLLLALERLHLLFSAHLLSGHELPGGLQEKM